MTGPGSLVPGLRASLEGRLVEIDRERAAIRRALRALDGPSPKRDDGGRPTRRDAILAAVRANPGARASVLALALALEPDSIRDELEALADERLVERDGLGWRAAG